MAYSTPTVQSTGDLITVTIWNQNVVYNILALLPIGLEFFIDGGGAPITTGVKGVIEAPAKCTIDRSTLLPDQSGSIKVDIWKCTYAEYDAFSTHPADGDSICASAEPEITSSTKDQDSVLSGWTPAIAAGDILAWTVDSCTDITWCMSSLKCSRS